MALKNYTKNEKEQPWHRHPPLIMFYADMQSKSAFAFFFIKKYA